MQTIKRLRGWGALVAVVALLAAACGGGGAEESGEGERTAVTLSLDFVASGRHAGFYVALDKGYYAEEGLDVKIVPGQGTAQVFQVLEAGTVQFGYSDVPGLVIAHNGGSTARMLSVVLQRPPYAIFSLDPGANVTRPEQLEGLSITSGAGSFTPKVIQGFMAQQGLDPSTAKFPDADPGAKNGLLLSGQAPAIETFIMSKPGLSKNVPEDKELVSLLLADHGLDLYANGIVATQQYISDNPEVVSGFVRASLRGWADTVADPEGAKDIVLEHLPALDPEVTAGEIEIVNSLVATDQTRADGIGTIDPARMQATYDFMEQYGDLDQLAPLDELYTTDHLPDEPVRP